MNDFWLRNSGKTFAILNCAIAECLTGGHPCLLVNGDEEAYHTVVAGKLEDTGLHAVRKRNTWHIANGSKLTIMKCK